MAVKINVTTTSGAQANGIDKNSATVLLQNEDNRLDNKEIIFNVSGAAVFVDTDLNNTVSLTNVLGEATVYFVDVVPETVLITAIYGEDVSVNDSAASTFIGSEETIIYPPVIDEAVGDLVIMSNIGQTAHIRIPKWNNMKSGDRLLIHGEYIEPWEKFYSVLDSDINNDIIIPIDVNIYLQPYVNNKLYLYYSLNDKNLSDETIYSVVAAELSDIQVVGVRGDIGGVNSLVSLNKISKDLVRIFWQYEDEDEIYEGTHFTDIQPLKTIRVFLIANSCYIAISPKNIESVGDSSGDPNTSRALILSSGKLYSWGASTPTWLQESSTISSLKDIKGILTSPYAGVILTEDYKLYGWGKEGNGNLPSNKIDIISVGFTRTAFAAISKDGQLSSWGVASAGGSLPNDISLKGGFKYVVGTRSAFCAQNYSNEIVAWGADSYGGTIPSNITNIKNIKYVVATDGAFSILTTDGDVYSWGHEDYGGAMKIPLNNVRYIASNVGAFVALTEDSSLSAWGSSFHGGVLPSSISELKDVISICSTDGAFCALTLSGSIYAWGNNDFGAIIPNEIATIPDIIAISSSNGGFSIISADGTVGVWDSSTSKISKNTTIFPVANYRITRNTPPNTFITVFNNQSIQTIGGGSDVIDIPGGIPQKIVHSEFFENCFPHPQ